MNTIRTNTRGIPSDTIQRIENDTSTTCLGPMPQQSDFQHSRIRPVEKQRTSAIGGLCND